MPRRLVIGISGSSGAVYGVRLLEVLYGAPQVETHLVVTPTAAINIEHETERPAEAFKRLATVCYDPEDLAASISSGSFPTDGMVVAPCSMRSLGAIATSQTTNLLLRAADVTLKERRRLVLLVRETPLHLGHLRLMTQVTEMGAIVMPPVPAFYAKPKSIDDMINQTVGRVLDLFGLPHDLVRRWHGLPQMKEAAR
ncbi:MAG: UbiX family flavin prenyltransferase [Chloroflexota bacterium]